MELLEEYNKELLITNRQKRCVFESIAKYNFLRSGTIRERIDYMLNALKYRMEQYSSEVAFMYDKMRILFFMVIELFGPRFLILMIKYVD